MVSLMVKQYDEHNLHNISDWLSHDDITNMDHTSYVVYTT